MFFDTPKLEKIDYKVGVFDAQTERDNMAEWMTEKSAEGYDLIRIEMTSYNSLVVILGKMVLQENHNDNIVVDFPEEEQVN